MPRSYFVFFTVFLVSLQYSIHPAKAQQPGPDAFAAYMDGAAELAEALDRTQFDIEALSFELAVEDPEAIAARVDALVATQIYRGALRGAEGTLRAGAGNSLDQALLLHRLLIDAGQEARIARATLSEEEAKRLVAASGPAVRPPALADVDAGRAAIARMEETTGIPGFLAPLSDFLEGRATPPAGQNVIQEETDRIVNALGSSMPDGSALNALLLDEAKDYFWVQARLFGGDPWQDLHVAYTPQIAPSAESFVSADIPEDLLHILRFKFELEFRDGDKLETRPLGDDLRVGTALLERTPIVYSIVPDAVISGGSNVFSAASETTFFFPLLNGELLSNAQAFTAEGFMAPASDVLASGGMASIVAGTAIKASTAGGLIGGLSGGGDEKPSLPPNTPVREATGLRLTILYDPPSDNSQVVEYRRFLVDRIGADRRAEKQILSASDSSEPKIALIGQWNLFIETGGAGAAEIVSAQIDRARALQPGLSAPDMTLQGLAVSNPSNQLVSTAVFDHVADTVAADSGAWTYRAGPEISILYHRGQFEGESLRHVTGLDIVSIARRALNDAGAANPKAALAAGVAATGIEYRLAGSIVPPNSQSGGNSTGSWSVLSNSSTLAGAIGKGDLPPMSPGSLSAAGEDLDRGNAVVVDAETGSAWWQVDPITGAAIGRDKLGRGGETAEYVELLDHIVSAYSFVDGIAECTGAANVGCCIGTHIAWEMFTFSVLGLAGEAAKKIEMADEFMINLVGFAAGTSYSASGHNFYKDQLCG